MSRASSLTVVSCGGGDAVEARALSVLPDVTERCQKRIASSQRNHYIACIQGNCAKPNWGRSLRK